MISYVINWIRSLFVSPTPTPPPSDDLLTLHNLRRWAVSPLALDPELERYAQSWAERMAAMDVLRHSGGPYAENIAMCPGCTAATVVGLWLSDFGHAANILNPNFRRAGFGHAGNYWCGVYA